jgi:outer membrane lipoprotein-sorting protein
MKYLIVSLFFFSLTALAQNDEKSQELLNKMSKEIKSLSSFYLEFSFAMKNASTGEDSKENGKGYVQGDKFNASLGDNEIISNGIKIWTVVKEENVTYESAADDEDEESINPKRLMTIWESGFKNNYVKQDKLNGKAVHVINLFPTNPGEVQYHTITLYIDVASSELSKAIMKTKDGTTMSYEIENFKKNPEIAASKFVYDAKKYPGYKLIRD